MDTIENTQIQPQNPLSVESISPKNGYKIALFVVLGLIVVGGLAYAGMTLNKRSVPPVVPPQKSPTPILTQVAQPTTIPASDPTANWKTYKNEKYGFEIKYPFSSETNLEKTTEGEDYLKVKKGISLIIESTANSIKKCEEGICPSIDKTETVVFNGVQFEKITTTPPEDQPFNGKIPTIIYFETGLKGSKIAQFVFSVTDRSNTQELDGVKNLAGQILSTFKFTK